MQEPSTLAVGTVIQGRYVIEGLLGTSAGAATFMVCDTRTRGDPYILFLLKEVVAPSKQARRRLTSEGKLLRRLHQQSLPRVHRVLNDRKNNRVYLLMDYIAGDSLEMLRQQQQERRFSSSQVIAVMVPVFAALTYLHSQHPPVIHGDIKPANIIISAEGRKVMLVGMDLKKACDPGSTATAERYCFRAPEQFQGGIDVRSDLYALAATCYTLLTGKLPLDAHSRLKRIGDGASDPLQPANSIVPAIPLHIGKAIDRAMSLNAWHRYSSVEQFWDALWYQDELIAPVHSTPMIQESPPADTVRETREMTEPTTEKTDTELSPSGSTEDRVEKQVDPEAHIRLPKPPPDVSFPTNIAEQKKLDIERTPPKFPDRAEGQEDPDGANPPPKLWRYRKIPLTWLTLSMLTITLAFLISLGFTASSFRARGHSAVDTAPTGTHTAFTSTSSAAISVYTTHSPERILAHVYNVCENMSTSISLSVAPLNQSSFSGYLKLGSSSQGGTNFMEASKR